MVPLFGPVPGGPELIIIFLVAILMFGLPLALVGGGLYLYKRSSSERATSDDVEALRREVEHLRKEIRQLNDDE